MSVRARGEVLESDGALIPPIEIGSFAALRPDKSDFIGSASGVFFVNTVFRAFAAAARPCSVDQSEHAVATAGIATAPDPASTHSYLAADEGVQPPGADDDRLALQPELLQEETSGPPGTRFYGVSAPALGRPPPPAAAKKLLMMYFRNWHPFFPFLHGPTFFEEVDKFYQQGQNSGRDEANSEATSSQRRKLCRAVTFQCIFNIAASGRDSFHLDAGSRIQSAAALTSLLGTIYGSHDISALQALLAAELYLTSTMSLRAASTVHGALTRILYHSGYHRCPFRFVQLSSDMYDIRKRIFWCAYVLDRHLSQALGYPVAIQDDEVDVCIPGMAELHKPVKPREQGPLSQPAAGDEVREHLPRDASGRSEAERVDGPQQTGDLAVETRDAETQSPAHHHMGSPETAGEYVLGYLVTYSRLLGASLNLFHKSIHTRVITREKVTELTYRIHTWWNSLPSTLQDEPEGSSTGANPQFAAFFTTLYHYLILLCNRPFLSLPPHTMGFRSCLQAALGASRSIVATRTRRLEVSISAWPGTLSATWMASLVIAFAGLLDLYPREKAVADLGRCLTLLGDMSPSWASASRCHAAVKTLHDRLASRPNGVQANPGISATSRTPSIVLQQAPLSSLPQAPQQATINHWSNGSNHKRRRTDGSIAAYAPTPSRSQTGVASLYGGLTDPNSAFQDWQPVLEYTGPDFGFDAEDFASSGEWQAALGPSSMDPTPGLLFSNAGFDAYVQQFGDRLNN